MNTAVPQINLTTNLKPTTAKKHFLSSPNHTANNMLLIPIEKIYSNRDSTRKVRDGFLIQKGRTIDPDRLNIREETYYYYLLSCYLICFSPYTYLQFTMSTIVFPVLQKSRPNVKLSLFLKKAGLASRNSSIHIKNHSTLCRLLLAFF